MLAAIPSAEAIWSAVEPSNIALATAAPIVPVIDVACRPCSKKIEFPSSRS